MRNLRSLTVFAAGVMSLAAAPTALAQTNAVGSDEALLHLERVAPAEPAPDRLAELGLEIAAHVHVRGRSGAAV